MESELMILELDNLRLPNHTTNSDSECDHRHSYNRQIQAFPHKLDNNVLLP